MSLYNLENRVSDALAGGPYDKPGVAKDVAGILGALVKSADKDVSDAEKRLADAKTHRAAVSALMAGVTGNEATRRTNDALMAQLLQSPPAPPLQPGSSLNDAPQFPCPREDAHPAHPWASSIGATRDDTELVTVWCPGQGVKSPS